MSTLMVDPRQGEIGEQRIADLDADEARQRSPSAAIAGMLAAPQRLLGGLRAVVLTVVVSIVFIPVLVGFVVSWSAAATMGILAVLLVLFVATLVWQQVAFWCLAGLVAVAPLPFASVYPSSWASGASLLGLLLAAWSVRVACGWEKPAFGLKSTWPVIVLFVVALVWAVLQAASFTPSEWHHPLWQSAADALGTEVQSSISLDGEKTLSMIARLLAYGAIFWLALQYCRKAKRANQVIHVIILAGLAYASWGLLVYLMGWQTVLWFPKFAYLEDLTSTFYNRNSFATYCGLALVCTTAVILGVVARNIDLGVSKVERWRRLLEDLIGRNWLLPLSWIAILFALILTSSRMGFFSTLVGLIVLVVAAGLTRIVPIRVVLGFGVPCLLALLLGFAVVGGRLDERFAETSFRDSPRMRVYELTVEAIESAPLLGTGLGSFADVFRFYRTPDVGKFYLSAHNTYLENVLELGVPAATALFATFAGFMVICGIGMRRRRRDGLYPCIGLAATALVATHAMLDFSLQIPAVTATYCLIMGVACAHSQSSRRPDDAW